MNNTANNYISSRIENSIIVRKSQSHNAWAEINFLAQEIISPKNRNIKYFEILSRVQSQSGETLGAEDFFSDLTDDLIIEIAKNQISYIQDLNIEHICSVNTTLSSLLDSDFLTS